MTNALFYASNFKVRQISHIALRRDHEFINTVEEGTEETHSQVVVLLKNSISNYLSLNLNLLDHFRSDRCI